MWAGHDNASVRAFDELGVRAPYGGAVFRLIADAMSYAVAAFYRFTPLTELEHRRATLLAECTQAGVSGSVLLAEEGVNGTLAGSTEGIDAAIAALRTLPGCADLAPAMSTAQARPFRRLKVRLRPEIVSLGVPAANPATCTGRRVAPEAWDDVLADPETVVIDTRNDYETDIGRFEGAVAPGTEGFRDFPAWWQANAQRFAGKRVAMYCTGGIRCEKASAHLLAEGVPEVRQLDGGILAYLAARPDGGGWRGACFVFDERVALGPGLTETEHTLCRACGRAVSADERAHATYRAGVSCAACHDRYSDADRARFAERQRQHDAGEIG